MFYFLLCVIFGGAAYLFSRLKGQNFLTRMAVYSLFIMSLLSLAVFSYHTWILSDSIAKFYNDGSGITYVNSAGNSTVFFGENSDEVAFYFLNENAQFYTMDFIQTWLIGLVGVGTLVLSIVYYALFHNIFGEKLPNSIEDNFAQIRSMLFGGK